MRGLILIATCIAAVGCQVQPPRLWLFSLSGRRKPFNYLNDIGQLVGFDVDYINAVCAIARQNCSLVLSDFTECVYSVRDINYPGRGIMGGWFDACPGYGKTLDRENAFDFTTPYLSTANGSTFAVAPGNPYNFNPSADDYSKFTLTHLSGAGTNEQCLKRLQKKFDRVIIARNLPEAKALLLNNTAQALFSPRGNIPDLDTLPQTFNCDDGGSAIMVKKGSQLPTWWNPAFQAFIYTGGFENLCNAASIKYQSHLSGAGTNEQCLKRLQKKFDRVIIARNLPEAKALLLNNTAQALFSPRGNIPDLDTLPQTFNCDDGGSAIMVKKGSQLPTWWNPAFQAFIYTGGFENLCNAASIKYQFNISCILPV